MITSLTARNKSDEVNAKTCKALLCMIEEASEKGDYEILVDEDIIPPNKVRYMKGLGFSVGPTYVNGILKKIIRWQDDIFNKNDIFLIIYTLEIYIVQYDIIKK